MGLIRLSQRCSALSRSNLKPNLITMHEMVLRQPQTAIFAILPLVSCAARTVILRHWYPFSIRPASYEPSHANRHTIVLMQTSQNRATRTFMDYDSISQAMDGICALYERKLKDLNPANRNITYDIGDLYNFIDGLADMSALVYDHSIQAYLPNDRQWIKQRLIQHLKKLAH
ncbi:hypothetical protein SADUNF_Sadunf18G0012900 [Salix dunnii]|uniref:Enhancer of rudimentary homolog n=1 Tax=Salix dunnii TaxID=1413687 RepID=A0A835J4U5_9ROSI|nr:hypothetical protein SADUNF_Sadunf18G0012900 [Salix dunnii]